MTVALRAALYVAGFVCLAAAILVVTLGPDFVDAVCSAFGY